MKKAFIPLFLAAVIALGACSTTPAPSPTPSGNNGPSVPAEDKSITVKDMTGREVTLPEPPSRVIAVTPGDCEIVAALAPETLIGRGWYCDWPESVLDVPRIQSGYLLSIEEILVLEPDLVILSTMNHSFEQIEALERAGLTVVLTNAVDIEGVYEAIGLIGSVLDKSEEAGLLAAYMRAYFNVLSEEAQKHRGDDEPATIYFEASPLEYGLWTTGRGTFMDEIARMLGLENAFADVNGWVEVSQEQVIERNPDYIITLGMYLGEGPRPDEEIMARAGWDGITAVKNRHVFPASEDDITRPGPRLMYGAGNLYELVYGEKVTLEELAISDAVVTFQDGLLVITEK